MSVWDDGVMGGFFFFLIFFFTFNQTLFQLLFWGDEGVSCRIFKNSLTFVGGILVTMMMIMMMIMMMMIVLVPHGVLVVPC